MDTAHCKQDNVNYHISKFIALSPSEISDKRYKLYCMVCENPAYFRPKNKNGKGACFGANPHVAGCFAASDNAVKIAAGIFNVVDPRENDGKVIRLNFSSKRGGEAHAEDIIESYLPDGGGAGRRHDGSGFGGRTEMQRNLSKILTALILTPDFADSSISIKFENNNIQAKNLFVNIDAANDSSVERTRIYWGLVKRVANHGTHAFLDGDHRGINLPSSLFEEFKKKFGLNNISEIKNYYIIGVGNKQAASIKVTSIDKLFAIKSHLLKSSS